MNDDDLVAGYLGRLVQAARPLPPDRRAELLDEIAEHIEQARAVSGASGPGLQDLLRRLGEPEAIAAAASDSPDDFAGPFTQPAAATIQPPAGRGPGRPGWLDRTAVLLTLGSALLAPVSFVLALLGWAVGIVMLLLSPRWPRRAKVLGAVTGTLALPLFGALLATLARTWNNPFDGQAGAFGWQTGAGPFLTTIVVTAAVVAATLVGVRLLRYPLPQPAGAGPAAPAGHTATGPVAAAPPEPAAWARAGR
ncbi:MAG: HAAS signaling domain-containing protein [Streptosporangiaceae bacterium]